MLSINDNKPHSFDEISEKMLVYLDQNILSNLRDGKSARGELAGLMKSLAEKGAVFVYSTTHVDECRSSNFPETFVDVLEGIPVHFMETENASDEQSILSLGRAQEMLMEPEDTSHYAKRLMEDCLRVWHFASGWLNNIEAVELKNEIVSEINKFWESLRQEVNSGLLDDRSRRKVRFVSHLAQDNMVDDVKNWPVDQLAKELIEEIAELKNRLPENYAQLDEVPDEKAVSFMFSCLSCKSKEEVEERYPKGFWKTIENRNAGDLTGLAFLLFMSGLVRDKRVYTKSNNRRIQYFRAQFRDGMHIENAARCAVFITTDKGATRLSRSIYAYAGVKTKVVHLKID
ncbi:hypothetical protein [Shimia thalassica]|uniref:hypothetical protein n=1 Tax=Shimia thalassica TaxID=1715693 RepID=UPI0026E36296|nr:hypothetical protein [Shimia thalassica]MDO6483557.1 hypothetical protein [Shimia thalassica]